MGSIAAMLTHRASGAAWLCFVMACGGGQTRGHPLDSRWSDDDGSELAELVASWSTPRFAPLHSRFIGVISDHEMVGGEVGTARPWRFIHPLESRPYLSGEVVVAMGAGELLALDARTGELLWARKAYGRLRGAGDDGETTIVSIASLSGEHSVVLAIGRDGAVVRQLYEQAAVGVPVVADAFAFLPFEHNTVVVFDLVEGSEVARIVSSRPVSHALLMASELYFGEDAALRFDEHIVNARTGGGSEVELPNRSFPGSPHWLRPGTQPPPLFADNSDRIRYLAWPVSGQTRPRIDHYALVYQRLALGLTAPSGRVQWVSSGDDTIIGSAATPDGFVLCDGAGRIRWIRSADGVEVYRWSVGERLVACAVRGEHPPAVVATAMAAQPRAAQLYQAATIRDARLLPIQLTLTDELAAIAGDDSTSYLIDLAAAAPPTAAVASVVRHSVGTRAREHLVNRSSGAKAMERALGSGLPEHAQVTAPNGWLFATGEQLRRRTLPPHVPIGIIAQAVARLHVTAVAPYLADYLNNPSLQPRVLRAVSRSLATLASPAELPALRAFLALHRCGPAPAALHQATMAVAHTLVRLGAAALVIQVATESCDDAAMRKGLLAATTGPEP